MTQIFRVTLMRVFTVEAMNKDEARERVIHHNPLLKSEDMAIHVEPVESEFG